MAATAQSDNYQANATAGASLFPHPHAGRPQSVSDRDQRRLKKQLEPILKGIKSTATEETVRHVFDTISRLREIMCLVELNVGEGGPARVTLAAFALVEAEARSLVRFIETRAAKLKSAKSPLRETLAGMSFAIRHEMKTVFGHDLAGLTADRRPEELRTVFMRAHGLLSNCFQQSIITLARAFDPSVKGELLFDDYKTRLAQSSVLLSELIALARLSRHAQNSPGAEASGLLIRELKAFCLNTIYFLMYKDWDEFEDLSCEVMCSRNSARHGLILHCFTTYLDALINQVRMRSVLNNGAPAPTGSKPLKIQRKPRG